MLCFSPVSLKSIERYSSDMESAASGQSRKQSRRPPPRRGQIKIKMIKVLFRSVVAIASSSTAATGARRKGGEFDGLSSSCATPPPSPARYNSDGSPDLLR